MSIQWAEDANFTNGPDVGTATKVRPSTGFEQEGYVPGNPLPAQYLNWLLNQVGRRANALAGMLALNWQEIDGSAVTEGIHCVCRALNGTWVGVGGTGTSTTKIYYSRNKGKTWAAATMPSTTGRFTSCVTNEDTGDVFAIGGGMILKSTDDGETFTDQSLTAFTGVDRCDSIFDPVSGRVILADVNDSYSTADGTTYVNRTDPTQQMKRLATNGLGRVVWVGDAGAILTTDDGAATAWTARTSGTADDLFTVIWAGDKFIAAGESGTIRTSPDGTTWSAGASSGIGATEHIFGLAYHGGVVIAFEGASGSLPNQPTAIAFSIDGGLTWDARQAVISWRGDSTSGNGSDPSRIQVVDGRLLMFTALNTVQDLYYASLLV